MEAVPVEDPTVALADALASGRMRVVDTEPASEGRIRVTLELTEQGLADAEAFLAESP